MAELLKDYEEYTTSRGEIVRIHTVPQQIIRGVAPQRPKPTRPSISMKTATGHQRRLIKEGDDGWDDFQEDLELWETERDELQEAISFVFALKSYEPDGTGESMLKIPVKKLKFSDETQILLQTGLLEEPTNDWMLKLMWIRDRVLAMHDEYNVTLILQRRAGVPDDLIDQMKDNFRRALLGETTESLGTGNTEVL